MRFLRRGFLRRIIIFTGVVFCAYTLWVTLSLGTNVRHVASKRSYHYKEEEIGWNKYTSKSRAQVIAIPKDGMNNSSNSKITNSLNSIASWSTLKDITIAYKKGWVGFPEILGNDCKIAFNPLGQNKTNDLYPQSIRRIFPTQYLADSRNCSVFLHKYGWLRYPDVSEEERRFPIAYIILFHKDLDQILFLLRAIYRPHNVYCLSVDTKARIELLTAVNSIARCLPNVFIASKLESIVYSGFTRLMADIDCMDELLDHPVQWKYVINLPGQQFPLRTNLELVRILTMYNGANDVEGITDRMLKQRFLTKHKYERDKHTGDFSLVATSEKNGPAPHKLVIVKGSAYGTFSRAFVDFVIHDPIAKDFLEWIKGVSSPDEYFWATLHHSKNVPVPGGFTGSPDKKPWLSTYASWGGRDPCATIHTRSVCIFSPDDLPQMMKTHALFANKFYITHHPAALHCLDELLFNQTFSKETRDLSYYKNLPFALKANTSSAIGG